MSVWVCVTARKWESLRARVSVFHAHKHCVVRGFCSRTHTGIVLPILLFFNVNFCREAVKVFTNVQPLSHWCAAVAGPWRPNFDLHSLWYQSSTALLADKTRRRHRKEKRFREQHICSRTWGIRGMKKMSIYIHIRDRVVGRHWFFFLFLLISFLGSERSNVKLTPRCQSWHVIQRNMVMNSKRLVQRAESSTGAVLKPGYGVPARTFLLFPFKGVGKEDDNEEEEEGWIESLGQKWNGTMVTSR